MQDSGVFHQQQTSLQQRPQESPAAMKKVTDEPLLCDDILSCILALDEVIAEFDDSHSLTNGTEPPGVGIAGCTTNTYTTTPASFVTSWSSPNSGPLTPTTQIRHNCLGLTVPAVKEETHNHHHRLEQAEEDQEEEEHNQNHYPFSSLAAAAAQPQVFSSTKNNRSSTGSSSVVTVVNSQGKLTSPTPFKPSHQTAHKLKIMSFAEEPLLPSEQDNNNKRVSLNQMEQDLLALGAKNNNRRKTSNNKSNNSSNGPKCKIPTLKSPTSPISIQNNSINATAVNGSHGSSGNGSGGGSFPKVKHRSSNPLLEYRSVKMQHFIFPDSSEQQEEVEEEDEVIEEENWNFPTGKNLPRSLARTRDTGGAAEEDNAQSKASNPRFKEPKSDVIKTSRIPKLKLETTCTVYEDNNLPEQRQISPGPKVKSPGSVSLDSPSSTGGSSGRQNNSSYNNSNIPVAKPRRNSANNPPHVSRNDSCSSSSSFSAIKVTSSTPTKKSGSSSSSSSTPPMIDSVNELPHNNQFVKHREAYTTKNNTNNNSGNNNSNILNNDYSDIPSSVDPYRDHHVSEADDGYLSLINKRDESTVLWPEEMIENEVFSEDELKRLSYQSASGSGCGGYMDDNQEIFAVNNSYNEIGADKTDYFSDDSLESESIEPECPPNGIENVRKTPTSISFFANVDYIRPAVAPVSKPRATNAKPSGIPKPCSFFVPMDDDPSNSASAAPTATTTTADSMESRGSNKRGKKSPPNAPTSSRPTSFVTMETKDEPTPMCDTPPFTSYIIIRDDTSAHGSDSYPSSPAKTNTPVPPSSPPPITIAKQLEATTVDVIGSRDNEATEPAKFVAAEKIQHFAQSLAYEIERSGSEEAAAALNQKQQQQTLLVEDQEENYCEQKLVVGTSENQLLQREEIEKSTHKMSQQLSDGRKTPPENMTPTRTTVAEFLASNVPDEAAMQLTRNEERLSLLSSPPGEKIGVLVEGLESTEDDAPNVGKSNKFDTELEQVDRIIANINKENADMELSPGHSEQRDGAPAQRPKSLDISAFSGNWQRKLDEDNTSDDLSETPPAFIPEPPPTVLELHSSSLQLEGLEDQKVKEEEEDDDTEEGQVVAPTAPAVSNETPAETVKVATAAPSISHSRGSSDGLRQPGTERKNSRSSEDIVQAVNRDPAPTVGRTRPGASTLPLNSRPPVDGKGSFRPLRSMISRFKKNKQKQSHLSLSDETSSHQEYSTSQHQQDVNGDNASTVERSNRQGSTKQRRNSASSSGSKKTSLFARIFFRRNK